MHITCLLLLLLHKLVYRSEIISVQMLDSWYREYQVYNNYDSACVRRELRVMPDCGSCCIYGSIGSIHTAEQLAVGHSCETVTTVVVIVAQAVYVMRSCTAV
jgi:hypothetical protein